MTGERLKTELKHATFFLTRSFRKYFIVTVLYPWAVGNVMPGRGRWYRVQVKINIIRTSCGTSDPLEHLIDTFRQPINVNEPF